MIKVAIGLFKLVILVEMDLGMAIELEERRLVKIKFMQFHVI